MFTLPGLTLIMLTAALADLRFRRIPNWLTLTGALAGILWHTFTGGLSGFVLSMGGMLLGTALLIGFYLAGGMGAGDSKLMGVAGAFLGPAGVFQAFVLAACLGGLWAVFVLLRHGRLREMLGHLRLAITEMVMLRKFEPSAWRFSGDLPVIRYGVVIALGTLASVIVQQGC